MEINTTDYQRRYDIDWLRVIAIGLLLIYHIAIGFQSWGGLIGFILSDEPMDSIWIPMSALNVWRIPLLFFVSGMGVAFAMRKRSWSQLMKERGQRILIPYVFGIVAIVPLHFLVWQTHYELPLSYEANPAHLWFLGNILMYVVVLSPFFYYLKRNEGGKFHKLLVSLFKNPLGLLVVIIPFVIESIVINPMSFETYAMNSHGLFIGFLAFFFGYCFIYAGETFTKTLIKWKWVFLTLAFGMYLYRLFNFELMGPNYLKSVESNLWVFAVLGIGFAYLNKPSKALSYLSEAVYPVYIIHMAALYLGSLLIFPLAIPIFAQFILLILFTGISCLLTYELIIKRVKVLRLLFGLKIAKHKKALDK
ncbi:acyltransferase [Roseivirga sp. 4D4]|uniref:acyltransferase family protein n=1 Tax=Roseivirga sp. 4D4 TaxID=1889784 RepID=UPI0008539EB0|nr:acyltransferase [Roseivirga sp. 4D4]OEK02924.1 acyltransferase [Roseivirga sp. 4D4]